MPIGYKLAIFLLDFATLLLDLERKIETVEQLLFFAINLNVVFILLELRGFWAVDLRIFAEA